MPMPLFLGLAAGLTEFGAKKKADLHAEALVPEGSATQFDAALHNLVAARESTAYTLEALGRTRLNGWYRLMRRFERLVRRIEQTENFSDKTKDVMLMTDFESIQISPMEQAEIDRLLETVQEIAESDVEKLSSTVMIGIGGLGVGGMCRDAVQGQVVKRMTDKVATNATFAWMTGSVVRGGMLSINNMAVLGGVVEMTVLAAAGSDFQPKSEETIHAARRDFGGLKHSIAAIKDATAKVESLGLAATVLLGSIDRLAVRMVELLGDLQVALQEAENRENEKTSNKIKKMLGTDIYPNYTLLSRRERDILKRSYQCAKMMRLLIELPIMQPQGDLCPREMYRLAYAALVELDQAPHLLPELTMEATL